MCVKNVRVHKKLGLRRNVASRLLYPSGHYVYKTWKCVSGTFYQKKKINTMEYSKQRIKNI